MISTDWLAVELAKHVCCSSFDVVRSLNCQACDLLACQGLLRAVKPKRFGGVTFSAYPRIGVSVAFILQYRLVWLASMQVLVGTTVRPRVSDPLLSASLTIRKKIAGFRFTAYVIHPT